MPPPAADAGGVRRHAALTSIALHAAIAAGLLADWSGVPAAGGGTPAAAMTVEWVPAQGEPDGEATDGEAPPDPVLADAVAPPEAPPPMPSPAPPLRLALPFDAPALPVPPIPSPAFPPAPPLDASPVAAPPLPPVAMAVPPPEPERIAMATPLDAPLPVHDPLPAPPMPEPSVLPLPEPVTETAPQPPAQSEATPPSPPAPPSSPATPRAAAPPAVPRATPPRPPAIAAERPARRPPRGTPAATQPAAAQAPGAAAAPGPVAAVPPAAGDGGPILMQSPRYRRPPRPPDYPPRAADLGLTGTVMVRALVSPDGDTQETRIWRSSGHPLLDAAAVAAVRRWAFEPARTGGRPVPAWVEVPVHFRLN